MGLARDADGRIIFEKLDDDECSDAAFDIEPKRVDADQVEKGTGKESVHSKDNPECTCKHGSPYKHNPQCPVYHFKDNPMCKCDYKNPQCPVRKGTGKEGVCSKGNPECTCAHKGPPYKYDPQCPANEDPCLHQHWMMSPGIVRVVKGDGGKSSHSKNNPECTCEHGSPYEYNPQCPVNEDTSLQDEILALRFNVDAKYMKKSNAVQAPKVKSVKIGPDRLGEETTCNVLSELSVEEYENNLLAHVSLSRSVLDHVEEALKQQKTTSRAFEGHVVESDRSQAQVIRTRIRGATTRTHLLARHLLPSSHHAPETRHQIEISACAS